MHRRHGEVRVREYDIDLDGAGAPQRRERREGNADHTAMEVSRALETRRTDTLGSKAMLHLQRAAGNAGTAALVNGDDEDSPVKDVVASSGQPLDKDTKDDMESRFGADFSDVQVHTDAKAADSARSVSAQAYTVGNHMVFGDGKFQPGTDEGRHMIAHELTHVVQQRRGPVDGTPAGGGVKISDPNDRFEQAADQNAREVLAPSAGPAGGASVQRQAEEEKEEEEVQTMALQRAEEEDEEPAAEQPAAEAPAEEKEEEEA